MTFGERGQRLYDDLTKGEPSEATRALADEAARTADRLDELDSIIAGKGVLELMRFRVRDVFSVDDEQRIKVEVKFDSVLSEARQQANGLRQILTTLRDAGAGAGEMPKPKGNPLDELARRRADGKSRAAGR